MAGASRRVGNKEENNEEGSYLATCDWLQTGNRQTSLKSRERSWHPEGHRQCMEASRGQCCRRSCWRWWVQESLVVEGLEEAPAHKNLVLLSASCL